MLNNEKMLNITYLRGIFECMNTYSIGRKSVSEVLLRSQWKLRSF